MLALNLSHRKATLIAGALGLILIFAARARYSLSLTWGESMWPTFQHCELLIVDQWAYRADDPVRGDIVIARSGKDILVKRVVGLPGEVVEVEYGIVLVNGVPLLEDYTSHGDALQISRGSLRGKYALVGDNRSLTSTELVHGIASREDIIGKVVFSFRLLPERLIRSFQSV